MSASGRTGNGTGGTRGSRGGTTQAAAATNRAAALLKEYASVAVAVLPVVGLVSVGIELKKDRKIHCACLGTALNVPLTKVTLYENGIMLLLAVCMAANLL